MVFEDFGCRIAVDEFNVESDYYFLTHCHYDHMKGFPKNWDRNKPLILSNISRDVLVSRGYNLNEFNVAVDAGESLDFTEHDFSVQFIDANHCIGSLIYVFFNNRKKIIHTGDFRFNDTIKNDIKSYRNPDKLYLDTTYNHPNYVFPSQEETISEVIKILRNSDNKEIFLGVYEIGKDKLLMSVYEIFGEPFYVSAPKFKIYKNIGLEKLVTKDKESTRFRAYSRQYMEGKYFRKPEDSVVIIPTGWAIDKMKNGKFHYVPYSEHCDFIELNNFIEFVKPEKIVSICEF
ncbi:hypothetical protein ACFL4T_02100 [candidate division KSB1 bacterium]